jgi:L-2-hydroxyglutarate oxidase LhgO
MFETDAVVVGAGVIGLAVARALALKGLDVIVLESESAIGQHTSSRNSEVIHAGIYYPEGSLKARLCVEGRKRLYEYCKSRKVAFRRCGKLIVATSDAETDEIGKILAAGRRNGVHDLVAISGQRARSMEPELRCVAALLSPSTGIFDSHGYMLALLGEIEDNGGRVAPSAPFLGAVCGPHGFTINCGGKEPVTVASRILVNCGGIFASQVAARIEGLSPTHLRRTRWAKGSYFNYGISPFRHLVYPVPEPGGLGVHLTLDLGGATRFGPDVSWVEKIDYRLDDTRRDDFAEAISRYWPGLDRDRLQPGYSGIRPKLSGPGEAASDFAIDGPETHGVAGLVNLFGIESPGLTASLATGRLIAEELYG